MAHRESRAIPKACGIETELGISSPGNPNWEEAAGTFVRSSQQEWVCKKFLFNVGWDPDARIRSQQRTRDQADIQAHPMLKDADWIFASNRIWDNGARFYLDCMHPEISTPTCLDPKSLVIWNRACYRNAETIRKKFREEHGVEFRIFRNNVAVGRRAINPSYGNLEEQMWRGRSTFACHVNIAIGRFVEETDLILKDVPFFIFLTPVVGAGKVGSDNYTEWTDFQISQRADWMEDLASTTTTTCRPIHNLRDNPYALYQKFRRVHIICFDSNMLELPEYLKVGLTSILYMMLEDQEMDNRFWPDGNPVKLFQAISRDVNLDLKIATMGHSTARPLTDHLKEYANLFWSYLECYHPQNETLKDVVLRFSEVIDLLARKRWEDLRGKVDWLTKKPILAKKLAQKGAGWKSALAYAWDVEYHDNAEDGLFRRLETNPKVKAVRVSADAEIEGARLNPPLTRSRWMTEILDRYRDRVLMSDYWYRIKLRGRNEREFVALYLEDPTVRWDEETAKSLLGLPFDQFLEAAKRLPFMSVEIMERRAKDDDDDSPQRKEDKRQIINIRPKPRCRSWEPWL